jgi:hypothetical protein
MLAMVSALVAFRGWPGGAEDSVASVPVARQAETPVELTQVRRVAAPRAAVKRVATPVHSTAPTSRPATTRGLVKQVVVRGQAPPTIVKVPPGIRMSPAQPVRPQATAPPTHAVPPTPIDDPQTPDPTHDLLPGGTPSELDETVNGVVDNVPGPSGDGVGAPGAPGTDQLEVVVSPGQGHFGITIGPTTIELPQLPLR